MATTDSCNLSPTWKCPMEKASAGWRWEQEDWFGGGCFMNVLLSLSLPLFPASLSLSATTRFIASSSLRNTNEQGCNSSAPGWSPFRELCTELNHLAQDKKDKETIWVSLCLFFQISIRSLWLQCWRPFLNQNTQFVHLWTFTQT